MAFNIHQSVFSRDGEYMEKAAMRYREQLLQLFEQACTLDSISREGPVRMKWQKLRIMPIS